MRQTISQIECLPKQNNDHLLSPDVETTIELATNLSREFDFAVLPLCGNTPHKHWRKLKGEWKSDDCIANRGKQPLLQDWENKLIRGKQILSAFWHAAVRFHNDDDGERTMRTMFDRLNFGINLSASRVFVLDIDPRNGGRLDAVREALGELLPATYTVLTGRGDGGRHIYLRLPEGAEEIRTMEPRSPLVAGVDLKGAGGQVVAEGSVHKCGNAYVHDSTTPREIATATPELIARINVLWKESKQGKTNAAVDSAVEPEGEPVGHYREWFDTLLRESVRDLAAMEVDSGRDKALWNLSCRIGNHLHAGAWDSDDVVEQLMQAAEENGLLAEKGEAEILDKIERGFAKGTINPANVTLIERPEVYLGTGTDTRRPADVGSSDKAAAALSLPYYKRGELRSANFEMPEFIISGLPRGKVGMIASRPDGGKTTLVRNILVSLACGRRFLDIVPAGKPRRVLHFDFETLEGFLDSELSELESALTDDDCALVAENFIVVPESLEMGYINEPKMLAAVEAIISKVKPDLVVFDVFSAAFRVKSQNDETEVGNCLMLMNRLAQKHNTAVLFTHHAGKAQENGNRSGDDGDGMFDFQGSSAFVRSAVMSLALSKREMTDNGFVTKLRVGKFKFRQGGVITNQNLKLNLATRWFGVAGEADAAVLSKLDYLVMVVERLYQENGHQPVQAKCIIEAAAEAGIGQRTAVKELLGEALNETPLRKPLLVKNHRGHYAPSDATVTTAD